MYLKLKEKFKAAVIVREVMFYPPGIAVSQVLYRIISYNL